MRYSYSNKVNLMIEPQEFNKKSPKEILQYAVGGLLYMPATQSNIVNKLISKEYEFVKSMVLDLEDSLGDDQVGYGQRNIIKIFNDIDDAVKSGKLLFDDIPLIFIRVREPQHIIDAVNGLKGNVEYLTGFNIPKFDKTCCDEYISVFKRAVGIAMNDYNTKLYIMPIIENKTAMYRQLRMDNLLYMNNALREISNYVLNIRVGGAVFCNIFGIRRNRNHTIYDIGVIRSVLSDIMNVFGKSYVISGPVWEYFGNEKAEEGLLRELDADCINGFFGKTSIHPTQLPIIQEFYIVDKDDYLDPLGILGMNANTSGVQKSASGRMNEVKTHSKWAKKIIGIAHVYGVRA